jgi:hypothetical protein
VPFNRFFFSLIFPLVCLGTSIVRVSLEDTVAQAEWIVEGDVVRNWCGWDSGRHMIWTHTEIAVRDRWKGSAGSNLTVSEPGGAVDGYAMDVVGMVRYRTGEHVVAFLYRTPIGFIRTVGLGQGKLVVDEHNVVHANVPDSMLVSAIGAQPNGTSIRELESGNLGAVHDRILRMAGGQKGVRK